MITIDQNSGLRGILLQLEETLNAARMQLSLSSPRMAALTLVRQRMQRCKTRLEKLGSTYG